MKKLLDSFYLVVTRWTMGKYDKDFEYRPVGMMAFLPIFNFLSFVLLIYPGILDRSDSFALFLLIFIPLGLINMWVLNRRYSKKFVEQLLEKYKNERLESRNRKALWVVVYIIFTIALFILACVWVAQ